jgi:hypothetical protein
MSPAAGVLGPRVALGVGRGEASGDFNAARPPPSGPELVRISVRPDAERMGDRAALCNAANVIPDGAGDTGGDVVVFASTGNIVTALGKVVGRAAGSGGMNAYMPMARGVPLLPPWLVPVPRGDRGEPWAPVGLNCLAYCKPHALHSDCGPCGPRRHSGVVVTPHERHALPDTCGRGSIFCIPSRPIGASI